TKAMNKILEETLAQEKPDPAFEQRMLANFRTRIPQRSGLMKLLGDLMRLRSAQIAAVAAVLVGLVQLGRMITGEDAMPARNRVTAAKDKLVAPSSQLPASVSAQTGALNKSDELATRSQDLALEQSNTPAPAQPATGSEFRDRSAV